MISGGNNCNYFRESQLTKLAHLVQFKRMLMPCPLGYATGLGLYETVKKTTAAKRWRKISAVVT